MALGLISTTGHTRSLRGPLSQTFMAFFAYIKQPSKQERCNGNSDETRQIIEKCGSFVAETCIKRVDQPESECGI